MKNQPSSVTFPSDTGPSHGEIFHRNGGDGAPQRRKQGTHPCFIGGNIRIGSGFFLKNHSVFF